MYRCIFCRCIKKYYTQVYVASCNIFLHLETIYTFTIFSLKWLTGVLVNVRFINSFDSSYGMKWLISVRVQFLTYKHRLDLFKTTFPMFVCVLASDSCNRQHLFAICYN